MEWLQLREKEIFETLKHLQKCSFVVIGGYAVNVYALPRFSIDCDIVVKNQQDVDAIIEMLIKIGYAKTKKSGINYNRPFVRYEKILSTNFVVSMDILIGEVIDRQSGAMFSSGWVFKNSSLKALRGRTFSEVLKVRVINIDALAVMKICSCRNIDIRDVFMLMAHGRDIVWIKEEVSKRCGLKERALKIIEKASSPQFKDGLQGVYGIIDTPTYQKHLKALELLAN